MIKSFSIKRGSTMNITGQITLPDGTWEATSDVRRSNGIFLDALDVVLELADQDSDYTHTISLKASGDITSEWPIENLQCDIRFVETESGDVMHSPTFRLSVQDAITDA
jgi:hypothetical protein